MDRQLRPFPGNTVGLAAPRAIRTAAGPGRSAPQFEPRQLRTAGTMANPSIDRIAPTREPRRWPIMRQNWRELLFVHWAVRPEELRHLVPSQLDLDLFEGTAYVGLV